MTGPHDGIIGMDRTGSVARFVTGLPDDSTRPPAIRVCMRW